MPIIDSSFELLANSPELDSVALVKISENLQKITSARKRAELLFSLLTKQSAKEMNKSIESFCAEKNEDERFLLLLVELVFIYQLFAQTLPSLEKLTIQAKELSGAHRFYYDQGGLIYYQSELLNQLREQPNLLSVDLFAPSPIKTEELSEKTKAEWTRLFYAHFHEYAELYPIGGAADRLNSSLEADAAPLPAAKLSFCNQFLLERLFCDLKAKEEIYFKLTGKRIDVPVVLMTSLEQKNHTIIQELLESSSYFGKNPSSVKIISQPLVPASDEMGRWIFLDDDRAMLRPAGHGVFWQLLLKEGVLSWLESKGVQRALIRQINNPIAGLDDLLTLLVGCGIQQDREFGFASTYFDVTKQGGVQEGCNVVMRTRQENGYSYALSNLEYTHPEFSKEGEKDWYKIANANLLYINLQKGKTKINQFVPPPFINRKKTKLSKNGISEEKVVVRLETTIQSISENFTYHEKEICSQVPHECLPAFLLLQKRSKTLSAIKKMGPGNGSLEKDTPELCLSHFQKEAAELLTRAGYTLPEIVDPCAGLPFIFLYTPLLGPYYSIILQKIKGGSLGLGSELICNLGEVEIENLRLQGSLLLTVSGNEGPSSSFVQIKNLQVMNAGLGEGPIASHYWKGDFQRKEEVNIEMGKHAELDLEGVVLQGSHHIVVPDRHRLILRQKGKELISSLEKISTTSYWNYRLQSEGFLLKKRVPSRIVLYNFTPFETYERFLP